MNKKTHTCFYLALGRRPGYRFWAMHTDKDRPAGDTSSKRPSADRILAAAEGVFAKQSYGETSLRQLMAAAGVSTTAFYARFGGKQAVLETLVERLLQALHKEAVHALAPGLAPDEVIRRAVGALVTTLEAHKAVVAITLSEGMAIASIRQALSSSYRGLVQIIATRLGKRASKREALAWAFVGALQIQVTRWAVFEELDRAGLEEALISVSRSIRIPQPSRSK
jgi:AcrR family transcriptional regulator